MKNIFMTAASFLALALGAPAWAQDKVGSTVETAEETPINSARLAAAKTTVDYLFPLGTYERMMKGTMDQIMDSVLSGVSGMTVGDMAGASGQSDDDMTEEEKAKTIGEIATEADPHFEERMKISTKVMMNEMVDLMTTMEPQIRTALSKIYARKYTVSQLGEMNRFFASDTGSAFARDYMMVFVDPEMMQSMMGMVPEIMSAMPDIMKKVKDATEHLPSAKSGVKTAETEEVLKAIDEILAEDQKDFAWKNPENWSTEDRKLLEELGSDSETALERYYEALETAQENAKKRLKKGK